MYGTNGIYNPYLIFPYCLKHTSRGWDMHINDMQMRLCIIILGVVSSIYGDFWEESQSGINKGIFAQVLTYTVKNKCNFNCNIL